MKKQYEVFTTVWRLGDYDLKKGNIVEITGYGNGWVAVTNAYMKESICVTHQEFYLHCHQIN